MKILCDVDGVLVDLASRVHQCAVRVLGVPVIPPKYWHQYDFQFAMGLTDAEYASVEDYLFSSQEWYDSLPWYLGAQDFIRALQADEHEVVFCTSPWSEVRGWEIERLRLLRSVFPDIGCVFAADKSIVSGDVLIDDSPAQLQYFRDYTLRMSRPWNVGVSAHGVASTYDDLLFELRLIQEMYDNERC